MKFERTGFDFHGPLAVAKIRTGKPNIRNPILVSTIARGMLPYRGLGSGSKQALEHWPDTDFYDDREGCLFTATVHRKETASSEKILGLLKANPRLAARELADLPGISQRAVEKQITNLRKEGRLRRIGPAKGGNWEVL
jgi:ATP-dependent DNA helicase RecG